MNTKIYKQCIDILEEGNFYENAKKQFKLPPKKIKGVTNTVMQFDKKEYENIVLLRLLFFTIR